MQSLRAAPGRGSDSSLNDRDLPPAQSNVRHYHSTRPRGDVIGHKTKHAHGFALGRVSLLAQEIRVALNDSHGRVSARYILSIFVFMRPFSMPLRLSVEHPRDPFPVYGDDSLLFAPTIRSGTRADHLLLKVTTCFYLMIYHNLDIESVLWKMSTLFAQR
jgi:hypothetical protein